MKIIRHIQLKIWPEIVDFIPALISFERSNSGKENPLDIDFSNITKVYSSSLVMVIIDLIKVIQEKDNRKWIIKEPENIEVGNNLANLGLYEILQKKLQSQLFIWESGTFNRNKKGIIKTTSFNCELISFPVLQFEFAHTINKRELVYNFREKLFIELSFLKDKYGFKLNKFVQIIIEMAKNAADHTDYNAFFGLDIFIQQNTLEIKFAFGDLGVGIIKNVRNVIVSDLSVSKRAKHLGLVEAYQFALTPGETTKKRSKINRGIGMTIIVDLSKDLGLNLSVFDGESRGILTKINNISHSELRKNFYHLGKGKNVGFYYYGELQHLIA